MSNSFLEKVYEYIKDNSSSTTTSSGSSSSTAFSKTVTEATVILIMKLTDGQIDESYYSSFSYPIMTDSEINYLMINISQSGLSSQSM